MLPDDLAKIAALDTALAAGRLSRMSYLLKRMQLAEEDAERIIRATPETQSARLQLQADDQAANRPRTAHRHRHWQD